MDEGAHLDVAQAGPAGRLDQSDLVGGRNGARLDLEAFARAFFMDLDECGQIRHGVSSCSASGGCWSW
jgi:hypothetical protein